MSNSDLCSIFFEHKGFVSDKWELYIKIYEKLFKSLKDEKVRILEIGVQNGGFLEILDKYFLNAQVIVGCDIDYNCKKLDFSSSKIKIVVGDSKLAETKNKISNISQSYDIVIDDGSHMAEDIIRNFINYYPMVADGGFYIVEDLHCSYWREYTPNLPKYSSMRFFKEITDILNIRYWRNDFEMFYKRKIEKLLKIFNISVTFDDLKKLLKNTSSISFYDSLVIVHKSSDKANLGKRMIVGEIANVNKFYLSEE